MTWENIFIFVFLMLWVMILHILLEPFIFTRRHLKANLIIFWVMFKITVRLIFHCPEECSHFNGAEWSHFSNLLKVHAWLSVWIVPLISKEVFISLMRGTLGKDRLIQTWSRTQSLSSLHTDTSHHASTHF